MSGIRLHVLDAETERKLAASLYNEVWRLIELESRTAEQSDAMIHAAHASRHHWGRVGAPLDAPRGEWLCSRVYAELGRAEPALWHARRCLELLEKSGVAEDCDTAAAYQALAEATRLSGNADESATWRARAESAVWAIADQDDCPPVEIDLADLEARIRAEKG
jgi:hypothetical protein